MKENKGISVTLLLVIMGIMITFLLANIGYELGEKRNELSSPESEYSTYEYHYEKTVVIKYKDNIVVYEYSYTGLHLIQIVKQGVIIHFQSKENALEFALRYISDIKREDSL